MLLKACVGPAARRPLRLYVDLFDLDYREEFGGPHGLDAGLGDDAKNEDRNDLKGRVPVSDRGKLAPTHISHRGDGAGCRIMLCGVDTIGGAQRVAVIESDEAFHLLPRVADKPGTDLDVLRLHGRA